MKLTKRVSVGLLNGFNSFGVMREGFQRLMTWHKSLFGICGLSVCGFLLVTIAVPPTVIAKSNLLNDTVTLTQTQADNLGKDSGNLIQLLGMVNVGKGGIISVNTITTTAGTSFQLPVAFIPGPKGIAALQADFLLPSSFTVTNIMTGPSANDSGKTVSFAKTSAGTVRMIVAGLNTNLLPKGIVVILNMTTVANTRKAVYSIGINNVVASDDQGNGVPFYGMSGGVTLQ